MDSARNQPLMNNSYPTIDNGQVWATSPVPPQNQGYSNTPNYNTNYNQNQMPMHPQNGGMQPTMAGQQPMPNIKQQKIIIIRENSSLTCRFCGYDGMSTWRQANGCTVFSWFVCLLCLFWPLCWLPFCMDGCKDYEVMCIRCGKVKSKVQADCC